eukprot:398462-Pyramimonas_sp.AAC.1
MPRSCASHSGQDIYEPVSSGRDAQFVRTDATISSWSVPAWTTTSGRPKRSRTPLSAPIRL